MSTTLYTASAPLFVRILGNLDGWLEKAQAHADAKKFDSANFLSSRLAPDMLTFTKQVQIACDTAKLCVARIAGVEAPAFEDHESTLAQLRERVGKTVAFIRSVPEDKITGAADRSVTLPRRDAPITLSAQAYLERFALPNFFFHVTTTYALLRHNGVPLGKQDFLGALQD